MYCWLGKQWPCSWSWLARWEVWKFRECNDLLKTRHSGTTGAISNFTSDHRDLQLKLFYICSRTQIFQQQKLVLVWRKLWLKVTADVIVVHSSVTLAESYIKTTVKERRDAVLEMCLRFTENGNCAPLKSKMLIYLHKGICGPGFNCRPPTFWYVASCIYCNAPGPQWSFHLSVCHL